MNAVTEKFISASSLLSTNSYGSNTSDALTTATDGAGVAAVAATDDEQPILPRIL